MSDYSTWSDGELIKELQEDEDDLTPWEYDFVNDLAVRMESPLYTLSEKQRDKLEELCERLEERRNG